jgi:hydrogenase nickel incorporation protein HypA/HybF
MHELAVCQALLGQVEAIAARHLARSVRSITVRVGPLAGVEPDLLRAAYPFACSGTVADGADLVIEELPVRVSCETCGAETEARANRLLCGQCGDWHTRLTSGDEMLLASVELMMTRNL